MILSKAHHTEHARIDALLVRQERRIQRAFATFLQEVKSPRSLREIHQLIDVGDHQGAMAVVEDHVAGLSNVLPQAFVDSGTWELAALGTKLNMPVAKAKPPVTARFIVGFDPSDQRAAASMRASKLRFVQNFTNDQRDATRTALATSFSQGASTITAARSFVDSIGLTASQAKAVENYRNLLEMGSKESLTRELRDRRSDRSVERAIDTGEPLNGDQIDRMVAAYRKNYLRYRAEMISRTEALRIMSQGRQEALEQLVDQMGIDPASVVRTWHATKDKRTRDSHRPMDGQEVGLHEPFISGLGNSLMYPGDGPAADSIHCRCGFTVRFN